jgi:exodeoxyribonuclease V gamma subunit
VIRLVYSNRTEELVSELASRVRAEQLGGAVLAPVPIVVPSAAVEDYVRLGIARECGIAANLQTMLITRFAADALFPSAPGSIAGADALQAMALTLLLDDAFVAGPDLDPVRAYLSAVGSQAAADVRRVQLAARIGRLFEQYTYSRSELLAGWSSGLPLGDTSRADAEPWQRRVWLAMFGDGGLARVRGLLPLHEAVDHIDPGRPGAAATVHVFGFAHFATSFHRLLARVAAGRDVVVYSLSPCEGFWEDFDPRDPAPLRLWGQPGREHVRALNESASFDHDDRFVEPSGGTLLADLQRDILRREPVRDKRDAAPSAGPDDESIVVLEHASIRRELEAVASEIWRLVGRDETLRFDEIAVLVPDGDAAAYLAHLPVVFREAHDIPHQLLDVPVSRASPVLEAVDLLLSLPLGRFTRQELLRLVVHPAVSSSFDAVDAGRWLALCDSLGIVHGADHGDHEDTYIERDILNWDQGLRRLALGAFMAGDQSGERRPFELGTEAYVPYEVAAAEMRDAAAFGLLVRSLVADARYVLGAELTMKQWATLLGDLVGTYVNPASEAGAESLVQCRRRIQGLAEVDLAGRPVPYRIACELARARIVSIPVRRGSEGVVVSRIGSVRPVPFRVVFACGMGEGRFPSIEAEDTLDLRWAARLPGDVTARQRDRYAFLELLLDTRERMVLSYVSRDPLTGDGLAASSVVEELTHAVGRTYGRDPAALRRRHPLRRWDPRYFPDLFPPTSSMDHQSADDRDRAAPLGTMALPEARAEARALAARRALERDGFRADRDRVLAGAAVDPVWAALADHLRLGPLPSALRRADDRVVVPIHALVKFLEFPLQGWAALRVGLDELEDDDVLAREDEPFETEVRKETLLLRAVLLGAKHAVSLERAYDDTVRDRELRGSGPSGLFAQAERTEHLRTLEGWKEQLDALEIPLEAVDVHRFGRAGEHATADRVHPPLAIEVDVADPNGVTRLVRVEIGGRTLPAFAAETSVTFLRRGKEGRDEWAQAERQRAMLVRAFVDHAVLAASGVAESVPRAAVLIVGSPQGATAERRALAPLSRGEATVWLRGLLRELLGRPHAYFFPCEALFVHREREDSGTLAATLERAREVLRDSDGPLSLRSAYGPVPRPHEYPIPDEGEARAMMARRFGALFDKSRGES